MSSVIWHLTSAVWPSLEDLAFGIHPDMGSVYAADCKCLAQGKWPCLKRLCLILPFENEDCLYELTMADRPCLDTLGLHRSCQRVTAVDSCVSTVCDVWPCLTELDLSNNYIDDLRYSGLVGDRWRFMQVFNISSNPIGLGVCQILLDKRWSTIKHLDVSSTILGDEGVAVLVQAEWPLLESINLCDTRLGTAACESLANSSWPELQRVSLGFQNDRLDADAFAHIVQAYWPELQHLSIAIETADTEFEHSMGSLDCMCLGRGAWPCLKSVRLSQVVDELNAGDDLLCLLEGQWPMLESVYLLWDDFRSGLEEPKQTITPGQALMKADWPCLTSLEMYGYEVAAEDILHLEQHKWPFLAVLRILPYVPCG